MTCPLRVYTYETKCRRFEVAISGDKFFSGTVVNARTRVLLGSFHYGEHYTVLSWYKGKGVTLPPNVDEFILQILRGDTHSPPTLPTKGPKTWLVTR